MYLYIHIILYIYQIDVPQLMEIIIYTVWLYQFMAQSTPPSPFVSTRSCSKTIACDHFGVLATTKSDHRWNNLALSVQNLLNKALYRLICFWAWGVLGGTGERSSVAGTRKQYQEAETTKQKDEVWKVSRYPLVICHIAIEHGPVEIASFPIKHSGSFHSYVTNFQRASLRYIPLNHNCPMVFLWYGKPSKTYGFPNSLFTRW